MDNNPKEDLQSLIDGIVKALTNYNISPKELGDALVAVMNKRGDRLAETNRVLDMVAADHAISRKTLKYGTGREHSHARKFVYCLLYFDLRLTLRDIAKAFGTMHERRISQAVSDFRIMDVRIKAHREFTEKYDRYQKRLQEFILRKEDTNAQ